MKGRQPPRVATLILKGFGPRSDALAGDLSEEYRVGRTPFWYWRQVLGGIAFYFVEDVRGHWVIALRSILLGLVILWSFGWLIGFIEVMTEPLVRRTLMYPLGTAFIHFKVGFYLHIVNLIWGSVIAGWVIARLHDRHRATAILGLVLTLGVLAVSNERFFSLIRNSLGHERFVPYLLDYLLQCAVIMIGVLIGGLVQSIDHSRRATYSLP